jgi:hypothetical protein
MSRCCCGVRHDHAQRTAGPRIDLAADALPRRPSLDIGEM